MQKQNFDDFCCDKYYLCYNNFIMKKVILAILTIVIISTLALGLSACNSATTQGQLANLLNDHDSESFSYDVYAVDSEGNKISIPGMEMVSHQPHGTYDITLNAYDQGATINNFGKIGETSLVNVRDGVLIRSKLQIVNTVYSSGCYYNITEGTSFMTPAYTFRTIEVGEQTTFAMFGSYDGSNLHYQVEKDGKQSSGTISMKGTYYDNNQFHMSLRTVTTFSNNFSFSFATALVTPDEIGSATLTASISSTNYIKNEFTNSRDEYKEKGIICYKTQLSRTTEVAGVAHTLYYAKDNVTCNGWAMKNVLVRIEEPFKTADGYGGTMVYDLKSATLK